MVSQVFVCCFFFFCCYLQVKFFSAFNNKFGLRSQMSFRNCVVHSSPHSSCSFNKCNWAYFTSNNISLYPIKLNGLSNLLRSNVQCNICVHIYRIPIKLNRIILHIEGVYTSYMLRDSNPHKLYICLYLFLYLNRLIYLRFFPSFLYILYITN